MSGCDAQFVTGKRTVQNAIAFNGIVFVNEVKHSRHLETGALICRYHATRLQQPGTIESGFNSHI